jgi:hypothetical protein
LLQSGVRIERILILNDFFWPPAASLPAEVIHRWSGEQCSRGIEIMLIRESAIQSEPDLLCDFGIYGERATGILELDDQCRTVRFTLDFNPESVRLAADRWRRLSLYAISHGELLEPTDQFN